ncbi:MAG: hypothetical protein KAG61_04540 [Bacteriovoracaceae bacterium]|nr:hypothetical protein [Bacteriovoracaceae bacterium]
MNFYGTKELSAFLNRDLLPTFDKIMKILKDNDLDADIVLRTLIDVSQGEDYAANTVASISKRLTFITTMDKEKTLFETRDDGWIVFGTIHSDKQQYEIKKVEGRWFAKVKLTHSGKEGEDIAIQVADDANSALERLFSS